MQPDTEIDIGSIPLPASVLNRRAISFRHPYKGTIIPPISSDITKKSNKSHDSQPLSKNKKKSDRNGESKFADIINAQKRKLALIDPKLTTLKKIYRKNSTPLDDRYKGQRFNRENCLPFESFSIDADTYHELVAKNQPLPMNVDELRNSTILPTSKSLTSSTLADIQSVHASTCNLVTALRASNQSVVGGIQNYDEDPSEKRKFGYKCNSSSVMNLKYGSLRSHKGRTKRSNSEQLNSYYHFQSLDSEMDNNNGALDSVLLPMNSTESHKLPWKHRQCPSSNSSTSSSSSNIASKLRKTHISF